MPDNWEHLKPKFDSSPYASFLGMKLVELSPGYSKVVTMLRPEYRNWGNRVHGGLLASLLDQAFGSAVNTLERDYVAIQLNINFISPLPEDKPIAAEAKIIHQGKTLSVAEMSLRDYQERLVAKAIGTAIAVT